MSQEPEQAPGVRRFDAIVLGTTLLIFIMSFLPQFSAFGQSVSLWHKELLVAVLAIPLMAVACAAFTLLDALLPQDRGLSLVGLSFGQWRNATGLVLALSSIFNVFVFSDDLGFGAILELLAGLGLASGIVLGEYVPSLRLPLSATTGAPVHDFRAPTPMSAPIAPMPHASTSNPGNSSTPAEHSAESFWACFPSVHALTDEQSGAPAGATSPTEWYLIVSLDAEGALLELPNGRTAYLDDVSDMIRAEVGA